MSLLRRARFRFWRIGFLLLFLAAPFGTAVTASTDLTAPGPWLVFDFSLGWGMGPPGGEKPGGVRFQVLASDGGPFERLFRTSYLRRQWFPHAINLEKYAGKQIRFRFLVEHIEGRIMLDYPHWGNPRIVIGPLVGGPAPREVFNFALSPMDKSAALMPDGTEAPLTENDPIFHQGLVTPGLLNRDLMLLVYAGDNYICVPGKKQPGIYMGVSMSVDYLRIGAGPDGEAWTGKMPPPVFAEWAVMLPPVPQAAAQTASLSSCESAERKREDTPAYARQKARREPFHILQTRLDTHKYRPGLLAAFYPHSLTLEANMGPNTDTGWAFAGIEAIVLKDLSLDVNLTGKLASRTENSFAGLLVDYHTPRGYQDRFFFGLGIGSSDRYDLRPADWILDGPPLTLARTMGLRLEFVDLSAKARHRGFAFLLPLTQYAPPDWDGRIWFAVGVQDLPQRAGLKATLTGLEAQDPAPTMADLAADTKQFIVLEDDATRFAISRSNGAIAGGFDRASDRRVMAGCNDRYILDSENDVTRVTELLDRVIKVETTEPDGRPTVVLTCENRALPGLTIEKRYVLEGDRVLSKKVAFSTSDPIGFFIRYEADTHLDETFLAQSSRAGALEEAMTVSRGKMVLKTEQVVLENFSAGDAPMAISTDYSLGLAAYRLHVNERFVLPGTTRGAASGWTNMVVVDYLKAGQTVSGEVRWVMFAGDFTAFDRHYQALPEYRDLFSYPRPEWVKHVLADAMCIGPPESYDFYRACDPLLVTTTIWFLNPPWGNWGPDNDPPKSLHHDVYTIAPGWRQSFPNARVAAYTNMLFDDRSDIYREHPDFAVRDLEGQMITSGIASDHQGRPTFHFQLLNPECREYLLNMHVSKFKAWDLDFFYMDGAGHGTEVVDWGYRDVVQSYDWLDFSRELRARLQQAKPDAAWFVNGDRMHYSDIGYIEWRDEGWKAIAGPNWRSLALSLFRSKLNEPNDHLIVPTYGNSNADPALSAYVLMYGWCGHGYQDVGRLPWMREAFKYRNMKLIEDAVEPRWWRSDVEFEAYGFKHGDRAIVNILDHAQEPREVTVQVDTARLGLREGELLYASLALMNDTASEPKADPADPTKQIRVWRNTEAVTRSVLFADKPCPRILELTVPTRHMLLTTVVLSHKAGE